LIPANECEAIAGLHLKRVFLKSDDGADDFRTVLQTELVRTRAADDCGKR